MKKTIILLLFLFFTLSSVSCTPRRDYSETNLHSIATQEFDFDTVYFFRILDSETIEYLFGTAVNNTCVAFGSKDGEEWMLWIPRYVDEDIVAMEYPLVHSIPQIAAAVFAIPDGLGGFLYDMPHDYGAIEVSVSFAQLLRENVPSVQLDFDLVFHFYTDTHSFYCFESQGVLRIVDENFDSLT